MGCTTTIQTLVLLEQSEFASNLTQTALFTFLTAGTADG